MASSAAKQSEVSLDFRAAMSHIQKGVYIKPLLANYLYDATFPDFSVHFRNHSMNRPPDGWFHPSTHPLWPERALYHYLTDPDLLVVEKKEFSGTISVTMGTALHGFVQMCLGQVGVLPKALQACTTCPPGRGCTEPGVIDEEAGTRGHMDGVLDFSPLARSVPFDRCVFEFKSTGVKFTSIPDLGLEAYRKKWPDYYAQNQEYMRMSGYRMVVVLLFGMGYPWEMREIHVPYDPPYALRIRDKYLRVRQQVADQAPSRDCCGIPKSCAAGRICDIGRFLR